MDSYSKYLRHAQAKYFTDVIHKAAPKAKVTINDTYWEHQQTLPFHIDATVDFGKGEKYYAIMEARSWNVKEFNTQYGMFVVDMYDIDMYDEDNEHWHQIYVNPTTLESTYNLPEEEKARFFKELAYWAENFESERYTSPKDGKTIPDLIDVVLTYEQTTRK